MPKVNITLFSQILRILDRQVFNSLVRKYKTDKHCKGFNSWTHLVSMLFCHLASVSSLRDISHGLKSATGNLIHLGVQIAPSKSSISYQNQRRDWHLFSDYYFKLLEKFEPSLRRRRQYAIRLKRKIFLMDSTTISLCLKLFDWAQFRQRKGAIKLHTILDYDISLPTFISMTDGKKHDLTVAKQTVFPPGSVLVVDRAYVDFLWFNYLDSTRVFFVTRLKTNTQYEIVEQKQIHPNYPHIRQDATIGLTGSSAMKNYPKELRIVTVYDESQDREFIFLTNNMSWTADTISQLYKARWDIETFFKEVKQVLKIKTFIGTTPNAVLIQVWTAMIAMLILKYLQKKAKYPWHLSNLVTVLRINFFVKIDLWGWINEPFIKCKDPPLFTLFDEIST